MAYRFTNTEKWNDTWFSDLKPLSKLLFMYLCDRCDIAGFLELNIRTVAFEIGTDKQAIEKALREIESRIMYSSDRKFIFIRSFLKNQRNYPLNERNSSHVTITRKLEEKKEVFGFQKINQFFSAPPTLPAGGTGISMGIGNEEDRDKGIIRGKEKEETSLWRKDYDVYLSELRDAFTEIKTDKEFIAEQERYHPGLDIIISLEKACKQYWATEAGWKKKKGSQTKRIDWKQTFKNALDIKSNHVYKPRDEQNGSGSYIAI